MPDDCGPPEPLRVIVERSGGIAGMVRTWRVEPEGDERTTWWTLVSQCPWDADERPSEARRGGADRFRWRLIVEAGAEQRRADLAEGELDGPWRELVEAVRSGQSVTRDGQPDR